MHSANLQELTLSMSAGTDGGRLRASGQFMSGYKPIISNSGLSLTSAPSDYAKGMFDFKIPNDIETAIKNINQYYN